MPRPIWILIALTAPCGGSSGGPVEDPAAQADPPADSSTWFRHAEDNSKFIERYEALHDSAGVPKDTTVIYTDTWSGKAKYDFSDSAMTDSTERQ